jgi:hypothetical protein
MKSILSFDKDCEGFWLNLAIFLRPKRRLSKKRMEPILNKLMKVLKIKGYKLNLRKEALNSILANLFLANLIGIPIKYYKKAEGYSYLKKYKYAFFTRKIILPIIISLEQKGYISEKAGYHSKDNPNNRKLPRIWARPKLINLLKKGYISIKKDLEDEEFLDEIIINITNDKGEKRPIEYEETDEISHMRKNLLFLNKSTSKYKIQIRLTKQELSTYELHKQVELKLLSQGITIDKQLKSMLKHLQIYQETKNNNNIYTIPLSGTDLRIDIKQLKLHRVFNNGNTFDGGRFYTPIQNIYEWLRKYIYINEEPTIELDFKAYHLRMLYHYNSLKCLMDDPYNFGGRRELNKLASNIIINSKNLKTAIKALRNEFRKEPELIKKYGKDILKKTYLKELVISFKKEHPDVKDAFYAGVGTGLQQIDSNIMEEILMHLISSNIPTIPIHDSIIIPHKDKNQALEVMNEVYAKHMNKFYPVIKEK